jgi:CPA1 family monovalent cation:H+ antiporter
VSDASPVIDPPCEHAAAARAPVPNTLDGCEDCLRIGARWVHLRVCAECGHVGCCDSSPNRHASKHHAATGHPVIVSFEPAERWGWCFVDQVNFALDYEPYRRARER